jgi:hypothetical protein
MTWSSPRDPSTVPPNWASTNVVGPVLSGSPPMSNFFTDDRGLSSAYSADGAQEWWCTQPEAWRGAIFDQGEAAAELYLGSKDWCDRRVLTLNFLEERRGQWHITVDCRPPKPADGSWLRERSDMLVPLITVRKYLLPLANCYLTDRKGDALTKERTGVARRIAFAILLALMARVVDHAKAGCRVGDLWEVTDLDFETGRAALRRVTEQLKDGAPGGKLSGDKLRNLLSILRVFSVSALFVVDLPIDRPLGEPQSHIVDVRYDSPVRVQRRLGERFGSSPLLIAPRVTFGGDAKSYHVQLDPPTDVMVVDSSLVYAYSAKQPVPGAVEPSSADDPLMKVPLRENDLVRRPWLKRIRCRWYGWGVAPRKNCYHQDASLPVSVAAEDDFTRRWARWPGPADPLSSRLSPAGGGMPSITDLRECIAAFSLYPSWSTVARTVWVGLAMWAVLVVYGLGLLSGDLSTVFNRAGDAPIVLLITVAGLGAGLSLYPREHLMTGLVLRPWRHLIANLFVLILAVTATSLSGSRWPRGWHVTSVGWVLVGELAAATLLVVWLLAISFRVRTAETTGGSRRWRRTGLPIRRWMYRRRIVPGTFEDPCRHPVKNEKARALSEMVLFGLVERYLTETVPIQLLDRGLPPATRPARRAR